MNILKAFSFGKDAWLTVCPRSPIEVPIVQKKYYVQEALRLTCKSTRTRIAKERVR